MRIFETVGSNLLGGTGRLIVFVIALVVAIGSAIVWWATAPGDAPRVDVPTVVAPAVDALTVEQAAYAAQVRVLSLAPGMTAPAALFGQAQAQGFAGQLSEGTPVDTPPWFVQLAILSKGRPGTQWAGEMLTEHCGGTLVAPRIVLTVAHCITRADGVGVDAIEVTARIAPTVRDDPGARLHRSTVVGIHADFEGTETNYRDDIALVVLPSPAPLANVIPASAWQVFAPPRVGDVICPLGMGLDGKNDLLSQLHLKRLTVERAGTGTIGLLPTFGEAFRPGDSGGPSVLCDKDGTIRTPLRLSGLVSSFHGADGDYTATLTNGLRAWQWYGLAAPALLQIAGSI